jgi:hypothetical protein
MRDGELLGELELEDELELESGGLYEEEGEAEGIFGTIGNVLGGLLGESEEEMEASELHELEGAGEFEDEFETEAEDEFGETHEFEAIHEFGEGEFEAGEAFFGKLIKRALPLLRNVAKLAAPAIGTAFGGPLGGKIGGLLARNLEGEFEDELGEMHEFGEGEFEVQEAEGEYEAHAEAEVSESEAQAELMAAAAAAAESEAEAEAMIGAATLAALTPRERRALRRALPHMVRATAILTRLLRRRRATRPMVRTVPTIVHHTARRLVDESARTGRPITRHRAARVMTAQTRRHLCSPRYGGMALSRNVRATRRLQRVARVPIRGASITTARRRVRY